MRRWTSLSTAIALALGIAIFSASSSASGTAAPVNRSLPTIAGAATEGGLLIADPGRWHSNSSVSFAYQWQQCLVDGTGCVNIGGANDRIYTARTADVGHTLRVGVTATNRGGSAAATSAVTPALTAQPATAPHNTAPPAISGSPVAGRAVVVSSGTWTGASPIVYSYRWRVCSAAGGDCRDTSNRSQTYRLSQRDVNQSFRVLVTARNAAGTAASLSSATARVTVEQPPAPQNRSLPRIRGLAQQGRALRGDRGTWASSPSSYRYSWLRCDASGNSCTAIPGADGKTYSLSAADVGHTIRLEVDATGPGGTTRAYSPQTAVVAAQPPAVAKPSNTKEPTISGTAQEGKTLTADRGSWDNSPTRYDYSWRRCDRNGNDCDAIGSANGTRYTLHAADVGRTIRLRVQASNASGSSTADSNATAVVRAAAKPDNTAPPTVAGTPTQGKTLTGARGNWTHSPTGYSYAWLRCDRNGNNCASISGAHNSTYAATSADVGSTLRFRVTAANSEGGDTATSVPTAVIQKAAAPTPPPPSRGNGCPAGSGNPDQVTAIASPARLLVDTLQSDPSVVTRGTSTLVVRFHVTSSCGGPVQGALVYATATPYNQFAIPAEAPTGADGWATLTFRRLRGFPVSGHQQLIAVFVRARKPGESVLGGISTRRLVSIPVRLG
jgi:hypothetical protein